MTTGTEQMVDPAVGGENTLGMAGGFEPAPLSLWLSGGLMGEFGAVVQPLVLAMLDAGDQCLASRFVALEWVGDDDPRHVAQQPLEAFAEKALGGALVTPGLNPDVQHITVLIHRPLQVIALAIDAEINLIQMPLVAPTGGAAARRVGEVLAEFQTPRADRLVGDHDAARGQQFLDIAITQGEAEIEPDGVADDLRRIAVARIGILGVVHGHEAYRRCWSRLS